MYKSLFDKMCGIHVMFLIAVGTTTATLSQHDCPVNLPRVKYLQVLDNNCYYFHLNLRREFDSARKMCQDSGGSLVLVKSERIEKFIVEELKHLKFKGGFVWIGLSYGKNGRGFVWEDGSLVVYENFGSFGGQLPSYLDRSFLYKDSVALSSSGGWYVYEERTVEYIFGFKEKSFVCEYPIKSAITTSATVKTSTSRTTTTAPTTITTTTTILDSTATHPTADTISTTSPMTTTATSPMTATTTASTITTATTNYSTPTTRTTSPLTTATTTTTTTLKTAAPTTTTTTSSPTTTTTTSSPTYSPSTTTTIATSTLTTTRSSPCPPCNSYCGGTYNFRVNLINGCLVCECIQEGELR